MTRVMIAVDGSELDAPLAATAYRLFGVDADYFAVNVQGSAAYAIGAVPTTFPMMYGGSPVGFGSAYPFIAPNPYDVRDATDGDRSGVANADERAASTAESAVDDAGISDAEPVAEVGDPPDAILRAAHEHDIDVIVVGDHDRSWWSRFFAPAVGSQLIDRAEIPVLVVSRDAADPLDMRT